MREEYKPVANPLCQTCRRHPAVKSILIKNRKYWRCEMCYKRAKK